MMSNPTPVLAPAPRYPIGEPPPAFNGQDTYDEEPRRLGAGGGGGGHNANYPNNSSSPNDSPYSTGLSRRAPLGYGI